MVHNETTSSSYMHFSVVTQLLIYKEPSLKGIKPAVHSVSRWGRSASMQDVVDAVEKIIPVN